MLILKQFRKYNLLESLYDNNNALDANGRQFMFVLMILRKIKEIRLRFSQKNVCKSPLKDVELRRTKSWTHK